MTGFFTRLADGALGHGAVVRPPSSMRFGTARALEEPNPLDFAAPEVGAWSDAESQATPARAAPQPSLVERAISDGPEDSEVSTETNPVSERPRADLRLPALGADFPPGADGEPALGPQAVRSDMTSGVAKPEREARPLDHLEYAEDAGGPSPPLGTGRTAQMKDGLDRGQVPDLQARLPSSPQQTGRDTSDTLSPRAAGVEPIPASQDRPLSVPASSSEASRRTAGEGDSLAAPDPPLAAPGEVAPPADVTRGTATPPMPDLGHRDGAKVTGVNPYSHELAATAPSMPSPSDEDFGRPSGALSPPRDAASTSSSWGGPHTIGLEPSGRAAHTDVTDLGLLPAARAGQAPSNDPARKPEHAAPPTGPDAPVPPAAPTASDASNADNASTPAVGSPSPAGGGRGGDALAGWANQPGTATPNATTRPGSDAPDPSPGDDLAPLTHPDRPHPTNIDETREGSKGSATSPPTDDPVGAPGPRRRDAMSRSPAAASTPDTGLAELDVDGGRGSHASAGPSNQPSLSTPVTNTERGSGAPPSPGYDLAPLTQSGRRHPTDTDQPRQDADRRTASTPGTPSRNVVRADPVSGVSQRSVRALSTTSDPGQRSVSPDQSNVSPHEPPALAPTPPPQIRTHGREADIAEPWAAPNAVGHGSESDHTAARPVLPPPSRAEQPAPPLDIETPRYASDASGSPDHKPPQTAGPAAPRVHIGRIEVRMPSVQPSDPPPAGRRKARVSLDELHKRRGGS